MLLAANFAFTLIALDLGGVGRTAVLVYTMPFWVIVIARIWLKERMRPLQWAAMGLGGGSCRASASELRALWRIRCQHPVIAVGVQARGRDERGQTLDQFQGREPQLGAPIGLGPGEA